MANGRERGLLDTNVIIDIEKIESDLLPEQMLITAMSLAELAAGPQTPARSDLHCERHIER